MTRIRETNQFVRWIDHLTDPAMRAIVYRRIARLADGDYGDVA